MCYPPVLDLDMRGRSGKAGRRQDCFNLLNTWLYFLVCPLRTDRSDMGILYTTEDSKASLAKVRSTIRKNPHANFSKIAGFPYFKRQHTLGRGDFLPSGI